MNPNESGAALRVLIVEDETDLIDPMVSFLQLEGFSSHGVSTLRAADQWLSSHEHDVLVLDLGLPDGNGLDWLSARPDLVRKGVIITTARGENTSRIAGARAGALAYLVKPVQLEELSRLIVNLTSRQQKPESKAWILSHLHWTLKSPLGVSMKLTSMELKVMKALTACPGQVVARQTLIAALGHNADFYDPKRLEILIRRLRTKADACLGVPLPLETAHGEGYSFIASIVAN